MHHNNYVENAVVEADHMFYVMNIVAKTKFTYPVFESQYIDIRIIMTFSTVSASKSATCSLKSRIFAYRCSRLLEPVVHFVRDSNPHADARTPRITNEFTRSNK